MYPYSDNDYYRPDGFDMQNGFPQGMPGGMQQFPGGFPPFPGGMGMPGGPGVPGGPSGMFPFPGEGVPGFPPQMNVPQQGATPPGPPPSYTPQKPAGGVSAYAIDPGAAIPCLYRYTYIWLTNGISFWAWLTFVGPSSIGGYRWGLFGWSYFVIDRRYIDYLTCI